MNGKTFIYHDGALGDLLLSLPIITLIRKESGFVHLAGRPDVVELLRESGVIDETSPAGGAFYTSLHMPVVAEALRDFLNGFDKVFVFTARGNSAPVKNIKSVITEASVILTIPPLGTRLHVAEFRLRQLSDEARKLIHPVFPVPARRTEQAREFLRMAGHDFVRPLIAVHCGSGGTRKCWPFGKYSTLLDMLRREYDPFFLFSSGPAEDERTTRQIEECAVVHHGRTAHIHNSELATVAALLGLCDLYIGNDSGVSHLAACADTRVIAVFGPTDPILWKPLGNNVRVVQTYVTCAPCGDDKSRECGNSVCLSSVSPERVYEEAKRVLDLKTFHHRPFPLSPP
jgi:ADP-heptose:LPS heptosyltransferase